MNHNKLTPYSLSPTLRHNSIEYKYERAPAVCAHRLGTKLSSAIANFRRIVFLSDAPTQRAYSFHRESISSKWKYSPMVLWLYWSLSPWAGMQMLRSVNHQPPLIKWCYWLAFNFHTRYQNDTEGEEIDEEAFRKTYSISKWIIPQVRVDNLINFGLWCYQLHKSYHIIAGNFHWCKILRICKINSCGFNFLNVETTPTSIDCMYDITFSLPT